MSPTLPSSTKRARPSAHERRPAAIGVLSVALVAAIASAVPAQLSAQAQADAATTAADHGRILGSEKTPVWFLIVSDFQCPFCREWHDSTWATIKREYVNTGKVRVAYINLPLAQHANARPAAIVAMCASVQGKFWPVADALFRTQDRWKDLRDPRAQFASLARSAGVDTAKLSACQAGTSIPAMVDADRTRMARAGAISTPTFFIGQRRLEGALPVAEFRQAIDAELRKQRP